MASPAEHLHALVDMGSNGIRFSITDLRPRTARALAQIHHHRAPISLHDAQYAAAGARRPLPPATIAAVVAALTAFQAVCAAHRVVPPAAAAVKLLATEATRTAPNAHELLAAIRARVGWHDIVLLPKEEEARLGALGVAASVPACRGVVLDLGGGSVQMSWVRTADAGRVPDLGERMVSLPYGAAAVMKRLEGGGKHAVQELEREVCAEMAAAVRSLDIPDDLRDADGNVPVFLSGGGFRGWGYLLMASHPDGAYPIQMVSGYSVAWAEFTDLARVDRLVKKSGDAALAQAAAGKKSKGDKDKPVRKEDTGIHRISGRRLSQLPAIKLVVSCLASTLKNAKVPVGRVTFCAGGVPTGLLYASLPPEQRAQNALSVAASCSADRFTVPALENEHLSTIFGAALALPMAPEVVRSVAPALGQLINTHSALPKDIRTAAALRFPVTGSVDICGALGIDHAQRAALGLALCARWGGKSELPEVESREHARLQAVLGARGSWWAEMLGRLAALVADVAVHGGARVAEIRASVGSDAQARDTLRLDLNIHGGGDAMLQELRGSVSAHDVDDNDGQDGDATSDGLATGSGLRKAVKTLVKVGKKKNWVSVRGHDGHLQAYGIRIEVEVHGV